jgi:hypothetical protein
MATATDASPNTWVKTIVAAVGPFLPRDFYGRIEVSIQASRLTHVNVLRCFKPDGEGTR